MDRHEQEDVVEYWNKVFLPTIKEFEKQMSRFEGPEMKRIDPEMRKVSRGSLHIIMMSAASMLMMMHEIYSEWILSLITH